MNQDASARGGLGAEQLLAALREQGWRLPDETLRQAGSHREFLTEPLLTALRDYVRRIQLPYAQWEHSDVLAEAALYLLAEFRETRAFALYLELCRLPEDLSEEWLGDILTGDFSCFLASTCAGQTATLMALAEDATVYEYGRWAALDALLALVAEGDWPRMDMVEWLLQRCEREPRTADNPFWKYQLASAALNLAAPELLPVLREAYAENLVDPQYASLDDMERGCYLPVRATLADARRDRHYVTDAARQMAWLKRVDEEQDGADEDFEPLEPYVRPEAKIGRNDPCPCGSGKKYKKCCLSNPASEFFDG